MKFKYQQSFLVIALLLFLITSKAQDASQQQADSVQRVLMRESIGLSDGVISQVLQIKHSYFTSAAQIRGNSSLSMETQTSQIQALRTQTNNSIKELLGEAMYNQYTLMISRRMRARSNGTNQPLAGNTN